MTGRVAEIWRHPIKAHGREALDQVELTKGRTLPWDRVWAVTHEQTKANGSEWAHCANFSRGAKVAALQAINAQLDEANRKITLSHPERPDLTFRPDADVSEFIEWVQPLMPADRAASVGIVSAPDRGMTDSDFPSISLLNFASNAEVEQQLGQDLSMERWRGNICFDGFPAWEEFDWIGRQLQVGSAVLEIRERIGRCLATTVNTETGKRDADTLGALKQGWGHTDFGVYGYVIESGSVTLGDKIELIT